MCMTGSVVSWGLGAPASRSGERQAAPRPMDPVVLVTHLSTASAVAASLLSSAGSSGKLCEGFMGLAAVVLVDSLLDLGGAEFAPRLEDGAFAVKPLRLDGVQPRGLDRQAAHPDLAAPLALDAPVMFADPAPDALADVPGGVV